MTTAATIFPPPPFADPREGAVAAPIKKDATPTRPAPGLADETLRLLSQAAGGAEVRALCINLDRRPERWEAFQRNCPIRSVDRFPAIDGRAVRPPAWWRQGGGAWGCMLSHIRILEQALTDGLDRSGGVLLVLEDDALFPPDFAERAARFIRALPDDWEQAYLGGQHRGLRVRQPERVNNEVVRPFMVNRTQAYAVRGPFIRVLYQHLCDWPAHARSPRHHVDHRMELLHASGKHKVYAPATWIVGQAGGRSDISGRVTQDRFWNGWGAGGKGPRQVHRPPVWVIGLHRSGSSVTAGILHRLGVHMGNRLIGYENRGGRGTGGFEAHGLAMICEQAYPFPSIERAVPIETTRRRLREWIDARQREAAWRGTIMGGKYPHLCFMIDLLLELEPESRFVHIDRPIDESIRSLKDRSAKARGWLQAKPEQCERLQRALWEAKMEGLARVPARRVLTVRYHDLLHDSHREISRIIDHLHLRVSEAQQTSAAAIVGQSRDFSGEGTPSRTI